MSEERIRIALQKSGELTGDSLQLMEKCGLTVQREGKRLICNIPEMPIDVVLVRDDSIPGLVGSGACDLGIVGEDVFIERQGGNANNQAVTLQKLGVSTCGFVIAVPKDSAIQSVADLEGRTIATSYPNLLKNFLADNTDFGSQIYMFGRRNNVSAEAYVMPGAVEVATQLGIADAIYDITVSGNSLRDNGLRIIAEGFRSEAVLIGNPRASASPQKAAIIREFRARLQQVVAPAEKEAPVPAGMLAAAQTRPISVPAFA